MKELFCVYCTTSFRLQYRSSSGLCSLNEDEKRIRYSGPTSLVSNVGIRPKFRLWHWDTLAYIGYMPMRPSTGNMMRSNESVIFGMSFSSPRNRYGRCTWVSFFQGLSVWAALMALATPFSLYVPKSSTGCGTTHGWDANDFIVFWNWKWIRSVCLLWLL